MKSRRRRTAFYSEATFPYELFGNIDINDDEFFNFTGEKGQKQNSEIVEFLKARSFAHGKENGVERSSFLQFRQPEEMDNAMGADSFVMNKSFTRIEDTSQHVWFISQRCGDVTPFARNFSTAEQFIQYATQRSIIFPTIPQETLTSPVTPMTATPTSSSMPAKWLDIQTTNRKLLGDLLLHFPLAQDTLDHCRYMDGMDRFIAHSTLGYLFFNLMCTPITPGSETLRNRYTKSVIQRRLDAAMADQPSSSVASPVPVAIIVFPEWIITVHEKPFHELSGLLKFLHLNCGGHGPSTTKRSSVQMMTAPFIFSSLFQILVGYQMDNVLLTRTLDRMGDYIFKVEGTQEGRDKVMQRITNVRRCLGECAAELMRREHIVSVLLQQQMTHSFLTQEKVVCRQLESARAYLLRLSDEVSDSRDTVAVTNWYHNTTLTWNLLYRGNRALRQTLLFTELTNIIYPAITIQTMYSMNVPVPFDSEGDPPVNDLRAFCVMTVVLMFFLALCGRAMYALFYRKRWATRLLTD